MLRLSSLPLSRSLSTIVATSTPTPTSPTDPAFLLRLCTVLFQHQRSPDSSLHRRLSLLLPSPSSLPPPFLHELFFQTCSRFSLSYRPLHRFLLYLHPFPHSSSTASRYLDILGKSHNIDLLWSTFLSFLPDHSIITPHLLCTTARGLAEASEVNKIVQVFSLISAHHSSLCTVRRDPVVNFESIFIGGLIKSGKTLEATKFVERSMQGAVEVPRFDYNKFLHCFSNEDGVVMFKEVGKRLKEAGMEDLGDIFLIYGERMATRDRRRKAMGGLL